MPDLTDEHKQLIAAADINETNLLIAYREGLRRLGGKLPQDSELRFFVRNYMVTSKPAEALEKVRVGGS